MEYKGALHIDLKELVRRRNISLYRLAKLSGTNYRTIWLIANNKNQKVYLSTLEKIAMALGCDVSDLFSEKPLRVSNVEDTYEINRHQL